MSITQVQLLHHGSTDAGWADFHVLAICLNHLYIHACTNILFSLTGKYNNKQNARVLLLLCRNV